MLKNIEIRGKTTETGSSRASPEPYIMQRKGAVFVQKIQNEEINYKTFNQQVLNWVILERSAVEWEITRRENADVVGNITKSA